MASSKTHGRPSSFPYHRFRKILTRRAGDIASTMFKMSHPRLFPGVLILLLVAMLALPKFAAAGCGCDKPPPKPAAVIPSFAAPGMPITIFDRRFRKNQLWKVSFSSGDTTVLTVARV